MALLGASVSPTRVIPALSLNAQQYASNSTFDFYPEVHVSSVWPPNGPTSGNTALTVSGVQLEGGSHYLCRFTPGDGAGSPRVEGASMHLGVYNNTGRGSVVVCNSSADGTPLAESTERLELSLNGQQYSFTTLNFSVQAAVRLSTLEARVNCCLSQRVRPAPNFPQISDRPSCCCPNLEGKRQRFLAELGANIRGHKCDDLPRALRFPGQPHLPLRGSCARRACGCARNFHH